MSEKYDFFRGEYERQRRMLDDPSGFLKELEGYIAEQSDQVLHDIFSDEVNLKRVWGGILLLASQLRKNNYIVWRWGCEPVVRRFWERVAPLVFREDDPISQKLKEILYHKIFEEEEDEGT